MVDEGAGREAFYVGMSRGRDRNTAYVVRDRLRISDPSPVVRPAPDVRDPAAGKRDPWRIHRFAVLGEVLDREHGQLAATEVLRREQEQAASLATLTPVWVDVTRVHASRAYEAVIRGLLGAAELAGHDCWPGAGTGNRRTELRRGASRSYAERTPQIADAEAARLAGELARVMDARVVVLGERAAVDRPVWALRYLGDVPGDPVGRADWVRRAGGGGGVPGGAGIRRPG